MKSLSAAYFKKSFIKNGVRTTMTLKLIFYLTHGCFFVLYFVLSFFHSFFLFFPCFCSHHILDLLYNGMFIYLLYLIVYYFSVFKSKSHIFFTKLILLYICFLPICLLSVLRFVLNLNSLLFTCYNLCLLLVQFAFLLFFSASSCLIFTLNAFLYSVSVYFPFSNIRYHFISIFIIHIMSNF